MLKLDMQQQINICKSYILHNHDSKITNNCALNVVNSFVSVHENILQTNKCANSSSNLHSISCHFTKGYHEFDCRQLYNNPSLHFSINQIYNSKNFK